MTYSIGIFGSDAQTSEDLTQKAAALGKALAEVGCTVLNGATGGLPLAVALAAHKHGAPIWGFADARTQKEWIEGADNRDPELYEKLFYVPATYEFGENVSVRKKYRNVSSTATCDAGIIISGRWGTLNEFTNLFDMGKVVGILTQTGGIADELPELTKRINKKTEAIVLFDADPTQLVQKVLSELNHRSL